ncbi:MAG: hypothetical protein ACXACH_03805 [Candidatus Hermodarchaeia archaeon]|jgi:hypothetical protein
MNTHEVRPVEEDRSKIDINTWQQEWFAMTDKPSTLHTIIIDNDRSVKARVTEELLRLQPRTVEFLGNALRSLASVCERRKLKFLTTELFCGTQYIERDGMSTAKFYNYPVLEDGKMTPTVINIWPSIARDDEAEFMTTLMHEVCHSNTGKMWGTGPGNRSEERMANALHFAVLESMNNEPPGKGDKHLQEVMESVFEAEAAVNQPTKEVKVKTIVRDGDGKVSEIRETTQEVEEDK